MRPHGQYVVVEGIDGAGKSTLLRGLARRLRRTGRRVRILREPADVALGTAAVNAGDRDPERAALLFTMDRVRQRPLLERWLSERSLVLQDRSFYSTLAYQGSALSPRRRRWWERLEREVSVEPDRVLWLALPPEEAMRRLRGRRGRGRTALERRRTLRRVHRTYRRYARARSWTTLDASQSPSRLVDAAFEAVMSHLRSRRSRVQGANVK